MALETMTELEARVRSLVALVQDLKTQNGQLKDELKLARDRLTKQAELAGQWEAERSDIRSRIEKVLDELEFFECLEDLNVSKEVALD